MQLRQRASSLRSSSALLTADRSSVLLLLSSASDVRASMPQAGRRADHWPVAGCRYCLRCFCCCLEQIMEQLARELWGTCSA